MAARISIKPERVAFFLKYWLPVILYAIIIFSISGVKGKDIPSLFPNEDVFFHIFEYAGFGWFIARAFHATWGAMTSVRRIILVLLVCVLYALSDEFHQSFTPGRLMSGIDVMYDVIGAFIASLLHR